MGRLGQRIFIYTGIIVYIAALTCSGSKIIRTSAKSLAERAGAAQYAVHIEEELTPDEIDSPHDLRKRLSDDNGFDDSDYEIYQGVVGRPGIDFPVLTGIPQTTFSCRTFGNGYFADLETECQAFHICEGGKKISFLCPNGTIFQQTELICDWWFKVNCAASPGHYAESSEVLSRKKNLLSSTINAEKEQMNQENGHESSKQTELGNHGNAHAETNGKFNEKILNENYDFVDISLPLLSQPKPNALNNERRGKAQNADTSKSLPKSTQHARLSNAKESRTKTTISVAPVQGSHRGTTTYKNSLKQNQFVINVTDRATTTASTSVEFDSSTATPSIRNRQKSTAAHYEMPKTTPFYTPTVPTIYSRRPTISNRISDAEREARRTVSSIAVAEHAMEMMKTLYDLRLDKPIESTNFDKEQDERTDLIIPPSSSPQTLRSLALYFATARDNLEAADPNTTNVNLPGLEKLDVKMGNVTKRKSTHVSDSTKRNYETLFNIDNEENAATKSANKSDILDALNVSGDREASGRVNNDLETDFSNNPIFAAAAGTPQIRELAQLFTHALSAYLHDPTTFRRVLAEIRPAQASSSSATGGFELLSNRIGRTEDLKHEQILVARPTHLSTASTLNATGPLAVLRVTDSSEVLDFSDFAASRPNSKESTTLDPIASTLDPTTTPSISGKAFSTTHSHILSESLKHIDHVPASRILTEKLEHFASNQYASNSLLDSTTETSNRLAIEINGGLGEATTFPDLVEVESNKNANNKSNYFSSDASVANIHTTHGQSFNITLANISQANSKLIHDQNGQKGTVRESWDQRTTAKQRTEAGKAELPPSLSFEFLPPSAVNTVFSIPNHDILLPIDDLQRAQTQSIFGDDKNPLDHRSGKQYSQAMHQSQASVYESLNDKNGHYTTEITSPVTPPLDLPMTTIPDSGKITQNPWSTLAYTMFLDPLTINDGLMNSNDQDTITPGAITVSPSPHTNLPESTLTPTYADIYRSSTQPTFNKFTSHHSTQEMVGGNSNNNNSRYGKTLASLAGTSSTIHDDFMEVMQRKANEMFGQLNDTSADHLMNVMKKADTSKTVRHLILLLIQTCDDDDNKTVDQSRMAILNALIGMDDKTDNGNELQIIKANPYRHAKKLNSIYGPLAITTVTQLPITTYHRPLNLRADATISTVPPSPIYETTSTVANIDSEITTNYPYRSTDYAESTASNFDYTTTIATYGHDAETTTNSYQPMTTSATEAPTTTTATSTTITNTTPIMTKRPAARRKPSQQHHQPPSSSNTKRLAKDLDQYLAYHATFNVNASHRNSDARALELLRSLYALAGRFNK